MCWYACKFLSSGTVELFYTIPLIHFPYDGFEWVRPVDVKFVFDEQTYEFIHFQYLIMALTAFMIAVGLFYRVAAILFAVCFVYGFLIDKSYYQNHYYLVSLLSLQLPFLPAHRACSVDAYFFPSIRSQLVPTWTLWLIRFQIGVPYFFGGIAKIDPDWLRGQPMRMSMAAKTDLPLIGGPWMEQEWVVMTLVWGGMLFDILIVPGLLYKKTRPLAYILAVGFHLANSVIWTIGIFPWFMILTTTVFFEPDWPRRLFVWIRRKSYVSSSIDHKAWKPASARMQNLTTCFFILYVSWQCLFPLRSFVYPGNSNWDEYTHHFAWHMLLRAKECGLRIYATDPSSGRSGTVDLRSYVTGRQLGVISRDPRMIHQLCRFIAEDLEQRGHRGIEIRALALISLNGRKPQVVVDPSVDLGHLPLPSGYPDYVMPLTEPFRHDAWDYPLSEWEHRIDLKLPPQMQLSSR
ncbi:Vitamin K-dependent gamma-carboxylase [Thalassoglobus polymorphus]|uniref:Vitamin K-dependent gamma-carboxylase n=2 Tax=Thalassoglobus polymorphus TaxID=2527994 RepID=A0A517QMU3_9PLAN|nr:Vitamin K-dependent gamma-carboxylase [Thalassoglobus polymorphus]